MDPADLKRLVQDKPWATLLAATSGGLVASHYPVLVDETSEVLPNPLDAAYAQRISAGTAGIGLTPTRVTTQAKLSLVSPGRLVPRMKIVDLFAFSFRF